MKQKVMMIPALPMVDAVAKVEYDNHVQAGTIRLDAAENLKYERACVLTTDDIGPGYETRTCLFDFDCSCRDNDAMSLVSVRPLDRIEVYIELFDGRRAVAGYLLDDGLYERRQEVEPGVRTVFYRWKGDLYGGPRQDLNEAAAAMCKAHPENLQQWKLTDKDGRRVILIDYRMDGAEAMLDPDDLLGEGVSEAAESERRAPLKLE